MKRRLSFLAVSYLLALTTFGQATGNAVVDAILSGYSPRNFTTEPVTDQQLDLILRCGIKAPSARNSQPWRFTVVRDTAAMRQMIGNVLPGNVLIVVSGIEAQPQGAYTDFDCALATHSMFIAAQALGLGSRIYGGPVANVISKREAFQIPAGFRPVIILRVGNIVKGVDAVTAATPRKKFEEIVNYYK